MHFHVVSIFSLVVGAEASQSRRSNEVPTGMVGSVPHNCHATSPVRAPVAV
jgi:hypothetical protein